MKLINFQTKYLKDAHLFYKEYCHKDNTVLLESAEIVDKIGVQSLIGLSAALKVTCDDLKVTVQALNQNGLGLAAMLAKSLNTELLKDSFSITYKRPDKNLDEATRLKAEGPMTVMRKLQELLKPCEGIIVSGVIAFDFINNFEYIGDVPKGKNPCSDYGFYVFDISIRSNHVHKETTVNAYVFNENSYKETAFEALDIRDKIDTFTSEDTLHLHLGIKPEINPDLDDEKFGKIVGEIKQHIIDGDAFQVVPSRTFSYKCEDPLLAYSYLKKLSIIDSIKNVLPYFINFNHDILDKYYQNNEILNIVNSIKNIKTHEDAERLLLSIYSINQNLLNNYCKEIDVFYDLNKMLINIGDKGFEELINEKIMNIIDNTDEYRWDVIGNLTRIRNIDVKQKLLERD